jgi:NitT/TauT family transport system substrate-binding protein
MIRWSRLTHGLASAILVLGTVVHAGAQEQKLDPVSLRVDVFFYGAHVPLLSGIVDGIYKKHGLDVTASTGRGSATTIQTVANGSDNFGFADGGTLVRLAAKGLKAKQIVGMLERNPMIVFTMPRSDVRVPKDLDGKTGGFSAGSSPEQLFPAFAKKTGIDVNTIKRVVVDIPTRDNLFLTKQTDFSFGYTVTQQPILQEKCGCTLNVFHYADYGINALSNGIVVSDQLAAEKPDLVHRFAQATAEAIAAAVKNPEHAVDAFFKYAKDTQLSRAVVTNQWNESIKLLHTQATAAKPYGTMDRGDWQQTIDLLVEYADVPKGAVRPEMVFTNEFLAR